MDGKYKNILYPRLELTGEMIKDMKLLETLSGGVKKVKAGLKDFVDMKSGEIKGEKSAEIERRDQELSGGQLSEEGEVVDPNDIPDLG